MRAILPELLLGEIEDRYETLGEKYLTENHHIDGRLINGMMYTDRIVNCREEVVDAVFCVMGQIYKDTNIAGVEPNDSLFLMLSNLIQVYSLCIILEEEAAYWNENG
jgi:hypothetical protein